MHTQYGWYCSVWREPGSRALMFIRVVCRRRALTNRFWPFHLRIPSRTSSGRSTQRSNLSVERIEQSCKVGAHQHGYPVQSNQDDFETSNRSSSLQRQYFRTRRASGARRCGRRATKQKRGNNARVSHACARTDDAQSRGIGRHNF